MSKRQETNMYDKVTIIQFSMIIAAIALLLFLGIKEKRKNEENIKKLPIRVNVNGIRGKSTATRLITGVLDSAGYKVVGKTTGTSPRMIYWNKEDEEVIQRNGLGANIKEQIDVVDKARKAGAEALVCECMAVRPEYQDVYQNQIFKSNITVIVNVLEDHLDVMGPTTDEIALAFTNTIPYDGYLVVDNGPYVEYFTKVCKERNTQIVVADNSKIPEGLMEQFKYTIFEDNISLALAVAEILKIDEEFALDFDVLGYLDPNITVCIIKDGKLVEKKKLQLPQKIINVEKCKNPRCITSVEQGLDHVFYLANKDKRIYRCLYCETKVEKK